jgi:hypothetical protein
MQYNISSSSSTNTDGSAHDKDRDKRRHDSDQLKLGSRKYSELNESGAEVFDEHQEYTVTGWRSLNCKVKCQLR